MPGRPSLLPIWYQPVFSQRCLCWVTPSFQKGGVGATAIHIYPLLRFRIWRAYMEYKQRIKVISAGEDLRRALGVIWIEDKSNELWPLQRSNQFIFSSSSSYDHCDPHVLTAENRAKNYSSISKSLIWAHANCLNALLKTTMLQEPRWPFPKSRKKCIKISITHWQCKLTPTFTWKVKCVYVQDVERRIIRVLDFISKLLEILDWMHGIIMHIDWIKHFWTRVCVS